MFDTKALAEATAAVVRAHINETVTPLLKRIEELEARKPEPLPDIDAKIVQAMEGVISSDDVKAICEQLIGAIPAPRDFDPSLMEAAIGEKVTITLAGWERPQDGKSVTVEELEPIITDRVQKAVAAIPAPKNGIDALVAMIDRDGNLVFTMSDGSVKTVGQVVGKNGDDVDMKAVETRVKELFDAWPKPKDGLGFDDLDVTYDGERTFKLKFARPGDVREFEFSIPVAIYRGVFKDGDAYKQGDTVTWGGHLYHCDTDTTDKPDGEQRCWTLAVRRGRDGKDTKPVKV
jgi:hypothetical protein